MREERNSVATSSPVVPAGSLRRPLPQETLPPGADFDRDEVPGPADVVDADAGYAVELSSDARMVVTKEADEGLCTLEEFVESGGGAHVRSTPVRREGDSRGSIVGEEDVHAAGAGQEIDLVAGVVPARAAMQLAGWASVVRRSMASPHPPTRIRSGP